MKLFSKFYFLLLCGAFLSSCKDDPEPYTFKKTDGWEYNGGDGLVDNNDKINLDFDIENNLNVDGEVSIVDGISIGNDLNLNDDGLVKIDIESINDTVYIDGNTNINDSLIVLDGVVIIDGDFNINANGVVNVSDQAKLIVYQDINHNGDIYGARNITVKGIFHQNGGSKTVQEPLYNKQ